MVRCEFCGEILKISQLKSVVYTDHDTWFQGRIKVCPYCLGDEFAEVKNDR